MSYQLYTTHGFKIFLDPAESRMMKARTTETYEPMNFKYIKKHLKKGMVFIDIGANKGDFTLLAASLGADVFSFEPVEDNFRWLNMSIRKNGFNNVTPFMKAVSNRTGGADITMSNISGHHSMKRDGRKERIETVSLNDLTIDRCDMMKIDVEGAEDLVFEGGKRFIRKHRPIILLDIHKDMTDIGVIKDALEGYNIYNSISGRLINLDETVPSAIIAEPRC